MRSFDRRAWATAGSLTLVNAAIWLEWATEHDSHALVALVVITGVSIALMARVAPRDRRVLGAALVLVLPVFGALAGAWAMGVRGRGTQSDLLHEPAEPPKRVDRSELARDLTRALPPSDALISHDVDLRRATIARLVARASAEDLQMLRWARGRHPEIDVEIALALEEIDQRFESTLRAARAEVGARPTYANHVAVFELIAGALLSGIVDAALVPKLASEARIHHDAARALEPERARALLATRARFELAGRWPELVIALLDQEVVQNPHGQLGTLYLEAAYALRAFDVIAAHEARIARAA